MLTCNIAGLLSRYTGEGAKTVLPTKAMAKLDFRLVPNKLVSFLTNWILVTNMELSLDIHPRKQKGHGICSSQEIGEPLCMWIYQMLHYMLKVQFYSTF